MNSKKYKCVFKLDDCLRRVYGDSLAEFKDGFWLDDHLQFTKGGDAKVFVHASKIEYIVKEDDENETCRFS